MKNSTGNVEMGGTALMRSNIYGFLSQIFYREVDAALLSQIKNLLSPIS